jgi:hypothetical protein
VRACLFVAAYLLILCRELVDKARCMVQDIKGHFHFILCTRRDLESGDYFDHIDISSGEHLGAADIGRISQLDGTKSVGARATVHFLAMNDFVQQIKWSSRFTKHLLRCTSDRKGWGTH